MWRAITFAMIVVLAGSSVLRAMAADSDAGQFYDLEQIPEQVRVITETGELNLQFNGKDLWTGKGVQLAFQPRRGGVRLELSAPDAAVKSLSVHWEAKLRPQWKYLGDAWERAYGELQWKELDPKRVMPWYFLASDGVVTHGYGVKVNPGALCYWTVDESGFSLHADVRCGGSGVQLGKRTLEVCTLVSREGRPHETPFAAAELFCKMMCPAPRLPKQPVYGFNDWYCSYGHDTANEFLTNVAFMTELAPKSGNRPFAVVDDGWQWEGTHGEKPGLWNETNPDFSPELSMPQLAEKVRALGARPGLWYRPLVADRDQPLSWRLQRDQKFLDPTVPEVRALIKQTVARFHQWGFELVKHDYTTDDICGKWGREMGAQVTADGWAFADRSKTTAEVIRGLYEDIREAAGRDVTILGCNTIGHLSAGLFEIQRIGDDTSGRDWNRTRQMGVNCLAFRAAQNGTFFLVDADCAGQVSSNSVPWARNSQWLYLLAHSGTALFVSFPRESVNADQRQALTEALAVAAKNQPLAEPVDWFTEQTPMRWNLDEKEKAFSW